MYDSNLEIAYTKSNEIIKELEYPSDRMISTSEVISHIQKKLNIDIDVFFRSFESLGPNKRYGAMMLLEFEDDVAKEMCKPFRAKIVINKDREAVFQRFSLFHELGHLATLTKENLIPSEKYVISTHIDYKVTNISEEQYKDDLYLLKEQIANIFALRVLMPGKLFYEKMKELNDISKVAKFFGLTDDAVISRMMIGA